MAINVANNNSLASITALPSAVSGGAMTLLSTTTASSSATVDITSGIDDTYKEYEIHFINVHPATNSTDFQFQVDTGTNTNYNQTITSTFFVAYNQEDSGTTGVAYDGNNDQAQGTAFQDIAKEINGDNDGCGSGYLHLFNPSSTTFVKHFMCRSQVYVAPSSGTDFSQDMYFAGYVNTTTAITRVRFKFASGDIDAGVIKLYGIS